MASTKPDATPNEHRDVFVLNTTMGPRTLRQYERDKPEPGQKVGLVIACDSKILGPGLNIVSESWVLGSGLMDMPPEFGLRIVDPLDMPAHDAAALVGKTASRQACERWAALEKRAPVVAALRKRLAQRGPAPAKDDD